YTDDILAGEAQLTVLPETAWTTTWRGTPPAIRDRMFSHLARTGGWVAIGLPEHASGPRQASAGMLANSVVVRGPDGEVRGRYDKRHLVPFGEYVPPAFGWFVRMMDIPLGEFARGEPHQPPVEVGGQAFAFDICYEDLFPGLLREQVRDGATVLVNISNIAWFGDSHALGQHLNISRLRAIELGRPVPRGAAAAHPRRPRHRGARRHRPDALCPLRPLAGGRIRRRAPARAGRAAPAGGAKKLEFRFAIHGAPRPCRHALLPTNHPATPGVLGPPGLRAAPAVRHGGRRRHLPHGHLPARDRARTVARRLRPALAPTEGRPLWR